MAFQLFDFKAVIETLESWGLMDVLLPFLLIFTIVFAVLQKIQILGKGKKNFNAIIALIMALAVVIPHVTDSYPIGFDVVNILNAILPQVSLILVAIIFLLILVGILGGGEISGWIAFICFLIVLFIFLGTIEVFYSLDWLYNFFGTEAVSLLMVIIIFGIIIYFITKEPTPPGEKLFGKLFPKGIFGG